ncbi:hypothetical protein GQ43DRAFT_407638 [Delitschia confertaspora ATCC 74209]|uniref:GRF-like zinc ribbon domain-containing protein n=1 Tax=Delitschia confertaspora ATCC 74209 TaxID=1513339 RepID=A0A9P4MZK5_9PLEO|nr:hypothetical protein GQ43DRAFT_407638 [Delitschia confertaspora ATCC 74209]
MHFHNPFRGRKKKNSANHGYHTGYEYTPGLPNPVPIHATHGTNYQPYHSLNYASPPSMVSPISELPSSHHGSIGASSYNLPGVQYSAPTPTHTSYHSPHSASPFPQQATYSSYGTAPAPFAPPQLPGRCRRCHSPNTIKPSGADPSNINSRRPYRKCTNRGCDAWNGYADSRGLVAGTPPCNCNMASRVAAKKNKNANGQRELYFICQIGACDFYENLKGAGGEAVQYSDVQLMGMRKLGHI